MRESEIMAEKNDKWKKVESQAPFRFDKAGDSIEGTVKAIGKGNYDNNIYTIDTTEGEKRVFGSAILDRLCTEAEVKVGSKVKIVYGGLSRTSKGFTMKLFEVYTPE
jgi:hypothetical protein